AVQPADRSLRARGYHLEYLLRLADGPRLPVRAGAGLCRPVPDDLQGLSAAAEGCQLQPGRGDAEAEGVGEGLGAISTTKSATGRAALFGQRSRLSGTCRPNPA